MTEADRAVIFKYLEQDSIAAHWVKIDNQACQEPLATYVVEVPRCDWHKPEVIIVQEKELDNLNLNYTFKEWGNIGQYII